jgi:chromosome segregation ATPase
VVERPLFDVAAARARCEAALFAKDEAAYARAVGAALDNLPAALDAIEAQAARLREMGSREEDMEAEIERLGGEIATLRAHLTEQQRAFVTALEFSQRKAEEETAGLRETVAASTSGGKVQTALAVRDAEIAALRALLDEGADIVRDYAPGHTVWLKAADAALRAAP